MNLNSDIGFILFFFFSFINTHFFMIVIESFQLFMLRFHIFFCCVFFLLFISSQKNPENILMSILACTTSSSSYPCIYKTIFFNPLPYDPLVFVFSLSSIQFSVQFLLRKKNATIVGFLPSVCSLEDLIEELSLKKAAIGFK